MAQLLGEQYFVARDINGALIVGAKAYFFLSGTSTKADVYEDGALESAYEQPILSNSAGRFPAIYIDPSVEYRMRVYDADDVEIEPSPFDPLTNFGGENGGGVVSTGGETLSITNAGGKIVSTAFEGASFRAVLKNDITIPINNGYGSNGGWYPTLDIAGFDSHSGLRLECAVGDLPNASVQAQFYDTFTCYEAPLDGIYEFHWTCLLFNSLANENTVLQAGFSHFKADGLEVYDDGNNGQDFNFNGPTVNLAAASGAFDNGVSVAVTAIYALNAGELIAPWFVRGVHDATLTLSSYGCSFGGKRLGPLPTGHLPAGNIGDIEEWFDFVGRGYTANDLPMTEAETVAPTSGSLSFSRAGLLCSNAATSLPEFQQPSFGELANVMAFAVLVVRFVINTDPAAARASTYENLICQWTGGTGLFSIAMVRTGSTFVFRVKYGPDTFDYSFNGATGNHQFAAWISEDDSKFNFAFDGGAISTHTISATGWDDSDAAGVGYATGTETGGTFNHTLQLIAAIEPPDDLANADIVGASVYGADPRAILA